MNGLIVGWRRFFKERYHLKTMDPIALNWMKVDEACWLIGPFHRREPISIRDLESDIDRQKPQKSKRGVRNLKRRSDPSMNLCGKPSLLRSGSILGIASNLGNIAL